MTALCPLCVGLLGVARVIMIPTTPDNEGLPLGVGQPKRIELVYDASFSLRFEGRGEAGRHGRHHG